MAKFSPDFRLYKFRAYKSSKVKEILQIRFPEANLSISTKL